MIDKVLAIIPARGGSKGLPNKNILELCGMPLIAWSIKAAQNANCISNILVTSDCKKILSVASEFGAETLLRPSHLATDETAMAPVVEHALSESLKKNINFKYFALLQPTSPLRTSKDIDNAFGLMMEKLSDSVISVVESSPETLKTFILQENGYIKGSVSNLHPFMRRQDLPKVFSANGGIYLMRTSIFMKTNTFITNTTVPYIMEPQYSIDIDSEEDFLDAKRRLESI